MVAPRCGEYPLSHHQHPDFQPMRAEIETIVDEIKQGVTLLRRHL